MQFRLRLDSDKDIILRVATQLTTARFSALGSKYENAMLQVTALTALAQLKVTAGVLAGMLSGGSGPEVVTSTVRV